MTDQIRGADIAVTTTNGTLAITKSRSAVKVLVGSFLNLDAIAGYLKTEPYNVMVLCAGWKGRVNMEDTLFAGALIDRLKDSYALAEDSAIIAHRLYCDGKDNLVSYMANASHIRRLQKLGIQKDITYCLQHDLYDVIPVLRGNALVAM